MPQCHLALAQQGQMEVLSRGRQTASEQVKGIKGGLIRPRPGSNGRDVR